MDLIELGKHLKKLRKDKGLTLMELSKESGVSNPYISQIENGKFRPSPDVLKKLSLILDESYMYLLRAAGYDELINALGPVDAIVDFSDNQDLTQLVARVKTLERALDIKNLLELEQLIFKAENIQAYYNGHLLTEQDRKRILDMLKTLFPEYQAPGDDLK